MKKSKGDKKFIERKKHTINASGQSLGRLASSITILLSGKNKAAFQPNIDGGDYVFVENIHKIRISGKKALMKSYYHFSGYPGGIKEIKYHKLFSKNPKSVLERAIFQMLPDNRLRKNIMKRLIIT